MSASRTSTQDQSQIPIPTIAITGGIATGKSTFGRLLRQQLPTATFFDADACVRDLLTKPQIIANIAEEFGDSVLSPDGQLDRPRLREQVFDSAQQRATLENILHPVVRETFTGERERSSANADTCAFIADIPLLFESTHPYEFDLSVTLAATTETQIKRIVDSRGLSRELAENIIAAQMPISEKMARADVVLWNEGRLQRLESQTNDLTKWLRKTKKIRS